MISVSIAAGVRVVKGVSQDLARNPVDLVLKERRQGPPRSFHSDLECRRFALRDGRSLLRLERMLQIALHFAIYSRLNCPGIPVATAGGRGWPASTCRITEQVETELNFRLSYTALGPVDTPLKVVQTAFTIESTGNTTI